MRNEHGRKPLATSSRLPVTAAAEQFAAVYGELRELARGYLRKRGEGQPLDPTAIVHEAYVRLADRPGWRDRAHLLATAAVTMRGILVDDARKRASAKRGGSRRRVELTSGFFKPLRQVDVLVIDDALAELKALNDRQATVVELRFFGGLTIQEVAGFLDVSESTVEQDWRFARAWLSARLRDHVTS